MSALTIDRLSAAVPEPSLADRVRTMLSGLADRRLDAALRAAALPEGEWCVRRVDVTVALDMSRPDPSLEELWAAALVDALRRALAGGSPDVVRYRRASDAVVDVVAAIVASRLEQAWAWPRLGVLDATDPDPRADPGAAVLAVLRRHPAQAVVALVEAVADSGMAAVHRLLRRAGWTDVATVVAGACVVSSLTVHRMIAARAGAGAPDDDGDRSGEVLARALVARSTIAREICRGAVRPDEACLAAWAVLVAAEADPAALRRRSAPSVLAWIAAILRAEAGVAPAGLARARSGAVTAAAPAPRPAGPPRGGATTPRAAAPDRVPVGDQDRPEPPATALGPHPEDRPATFATVWAGLLFLVRTAPIDALLDDATFAERPLWWVLHGLARRLVPAADDDPAVLALAGLDPSDEPPTRTGRPPTTGESARLDAHVGRWAGDTAGLLGRADEDAFAVLAEVALRRGELAAEPGWLDVHLRLDDVDLAVRRAGLDIDPGWVAWMGRVVRFRYA
jgi:hypothetical protein